MPQLTLDVNEAENLALREVATRLEMSVEDLAAALARGARAALSQLIEDHERRVREEIQRLSASLTPQRLDELATRYPPPQEWFDRDEKLYD